jgi:hypothetical protein
VPAAANAASFLMRRPIGRDGLVTRHADGRRRKVTHLAGVRVDVTLPALEVEREVALVL